MRSHRFGCIWMSSDMFGHFQTISPKFFKFGEPNFRKISPNFWAQLFPKFLGPKFLKIFLKFWGQSFPKLFPKIFGPKISQKYDFINIFWPKIPQQYDNIKRNLKNTDPTDRPILPIVRIVRMIPYVIVNRISTIQVNVSFS